MTLRAAGVLAALVLLAAIPAHAGHGPVTLDAVRQSYAVAPSDTDPTTCEPGIPTRCDGPPGAESRNEFTVTLTNHGDVEMSDLIVAWKVQLLPALVTHSSPAPTRLSETIPPHATVTLVVSAPHVPPARETCLTVSGKAGLASVATHELCVRISTLQGVDLDAALP